MTHPLPQPLSDADWPEAAQALRDGFAGLSADIGQPEGITLDERGFLYILSEPNLLFRFEPPRERGTLARN